MYLCYGSVLLDGYLAQVQTMGIRAHRPAEGMCKAHTRAITEYGISKLYSLTWVHLGDLFFFSNEYLEKKMDLKVTSKIQINPTPK